MRTCTPARTTMARLKKNFNPSHVHDKIYSVYTSPRILLKISLEKYVEKYLILSCFSYTPVYFNFIVFS